MGNMKVLTTAEVVIGNCDILSFTREIDEETGFDELVVKEKVNLCMHYPLDKSLSSGLCNYWFA